MKNKIQLITYGDSLGGNLKQLKKILNKHFKGVVYGVHILPFFPSSSDRGFSPLTHKEVDKKLGNWSDVNALSKDFELIFDLMVNHVSSQSEEFQDYLKKGEQSRYKDFFISADKFSRRFKINFKYKILNRLFDCLSHMTSFLRELDFVFHRNGVNVFSLKKIYRPRPGSPFVKFKVGKIEKEKYLWCTFSEDQIDIDIKNPDVKDRFCRAMDVFAKNGCKLIRLDAVGYCGKRRGTNNFLIPETFDFINWLARKAQERKMKVLPEVHFYYQKQLELAKLENVDFVYDFALPVLMLQALFDQDFRQLKNWIKIRPENQITTLDTHDGIGIVDGKGLLSDDFLEKTANQIKKNGGNATLRATGLNSNNVDIYQINVTYYSALGEDDNKYLIARAIQFFLPGIPQVYYVGALVGSNDEERLKETGIGRDVNRHSYTMQEVDKEVEREVVKRLFELMRFRNEHLAFNGDFELEKSNQTSLIVSWKNQASFCRLKVDLVTYSAEIEYFDVDFGGMQKLKIC